MSKFSWAAVTAVVVGLVLLTIVGLLWKAFYPYAYAASTISALYQGYVFGGPPDRLCDLSVERSSAGAPLFFVKLGDGNAIQFQDITTDVVESWSASGYASWDKREETDSAGNQWTIYFGRSALARFKNGEIEVLSLLDVTGRVSVGKASHSMVPLPMSREAMLSEFGEPLSWQRHRSDPWRP